jgi:pimeloyl-ACP methyl ester carboxylesterase
MATRDRRQFRTLYRLSLARLVDLEIISSRGDLYGLIARSSGIVVALSLSLVLMVVVPYHRLPASKIRAHIPNDEEFLLSITLAVVGLFSILAWNNVLPDRRDCLVLGVLPVRTRTVALSRIAAMLTCIFALVVLVNALTGTTFPYLLGKGLWGSFRSFAAWWITVLAAGIFAFSWTLALQAAAAQMLPWNTFLRVSGALQLASLFVILGFFFLTPPFALTLTTNRDLAPFLPSFWFTGLLNVLTGNHDPVLAGLAIMGIRNLAVTAVAAACLFAFSWFRHMRSIVESPEIASSRGQTIAARCAKLLVRGIFRRPLDRAILLFTARTAARSRQHRLLLAAYGGIGLALAATFSKGLLGVSTGLRWSQPNVPILVIGTLPLVCAVVAMRAIFVLPHALSANWIFRITAVQSPASYFAAVRKSLIVLAGFPPWIVCGAVLIASWPGRFSLEAWLVLGLLGSILVDYLLYQFRKVPFACSWLPASGESLNTVRAMGYFFGFLAFASALGGIELWAMRNTGRFLVLCGCLACWSLWLRRRGREFAGSLGNAVQFDDDAKPEIFALDLRPDGNWSSEEAWVDAIDARSGRSVWARLQAVGLIVITFAVAGFLYERVSEWRDRQQFPQVGRSFDIGGRSLNLFCQGGGKPAVVMDSGGNQPGYSWILVQNGLSVFTQACWYDRAGYGWSDPAPGDRTSADIAEDLHKLLRAAGVAPPYVLVGHSFGGFNVRVFASQWREETAGLVLVDSASENQDAEGEVPEGAQSPVTRIVPRFLWRPLLEFATVLAREGVARMLDDGPSSPPGRMSDRDWAIVHTLQLQPKSFYADGQEGLGRLESIKQVKAVHNLGSMPLIVLTAGGYLPLPAIQEHDRGRKTYLQYRVYEDQPRMLSLSTNARQIVVRSGHGVPFDHPDAVVEAVREIIHR